MWRSNSCTYDAVLTILFNMWTESPVVRTEQFIALNSDYLSSLATSFSEYRDILGGLDKCHDILHHCLQRAWPRIFAWGEESSVHSLLEALLESSSLVYHTILMCPSCHQMTRHPIPHTNCFQGGMDNPSSIQNYIDGQHSQASSRCHNCDIYKV